MFSKFFAKMQSKKVFFCVNIDAPGLTYLYNVKCKKLQFQLYMNTNTKLNCLHFIFLISTCWDIWKNISMISINDQLVLAQAMLKLSFILLERGSRAFWGEAVVLGSLEVMNSFLYTFCFQRLCKQQRFSTVCFRSSISVWGTRFC